MRDDEEAGWRHQGRGEQQNHKNHRYLAIVVVVVVIIIIIIISSSSSRSYFNAAPAATNPCSLSPKALSHASLTRRNMSSTALASTCATLNNATTSAPRSATTSRQMLLAHLSSRQRQVFFCDAAVEIKSTVFQSRVIRPRGQPDDGVCPLFAATKGRFEFGAKTWHGSRNSWSVSPACGAAQLMFSSRQQKK